MLKLDLTQFRAMHLSLIPKGNFFKYSFVASLQNVLCAFDSVLMGKGGDRGRLNLGLNYCFTSDHQNFAVCSRSDRLWVHNHDIVLGLIDLVMRLSKYIHLGFGKKLSSND